MNWAVVRIKLVPATNSINNSGDGFSVETTTTINEVTSFSDQQGLAVDSSSNITPRMSLNPYADVTLHDFLSRPFMIDQFAWTTNDSQFTLLKDWSFPYELFKRPALINKMRNFQYFRGNLRVSLRINSTRFHYGRLAMTFSPNLRNVNEGVASLRRTPGYVHCMALPNLQINATEAEVSELVVPFSLPFEFIDLKKLGTYEGAAMYEMGTVKLFVMNELASNSDSPIHCTVFASFEEVKLAGFTSEPTITLIPPAPLIAPDPPGTKSFADVLELQMGDTEQRQKSSSGLLSGVAESVASFAAPFSLIPGVGEFATAIATGASAIGGIAKSFGYSKPIDQSSTTFVQGRFPVLSHGKGLETAPTMGTFPDNAVSPSPEYLSADSDGMQLSQICSTPGFIGSFSVSDSSAINSTVFERHVTPIDCLCTDPIAGVVFVDHTPLSFTTAAFEYWRGSLRYHFQIVASSFHSVRLRVAWVPPNSVHGNDPDELINLTNHIIDINTTTDLNVSIPMLNAFPWLAVPMNKDSLDRSTNGKIVVSVVNELTFSEADIPPISVNVFMSAGPDFQLAWPTNYRLEEAIIPTPEVLELQVGTSLEDIRNLDYPSILPSQLYVENNLCHGEQVTHLKHLLQRSCPTASERDPGTYRYNPYTLRAESLNGNDLRFSFLSWFGQLFRYARGSFGLRGLRLGGNGYFVFQNRRVTSLGPQRHSTLANMGTEYYGVGTHFVPSHDTFIPEAITPYYSTQYGIPINSGGQPYITNAPVIDYKIVSAGALMVEYAGDDFLYGFRLGGPRVTTRLVNWNYMNTS